MNQDTMNRLGAYVDPQALTGQAIYNPGNPFLSVEAVEGGFILKGCFSGRDQKRVALSVEGVAAIVQEWAAQGK